MLANYIIRHKDYNPKKAFYGFIGREFPIEIHKYRNHPEAQSAKAKILEAIDYGRYSDLSILNQVHGNKTVAIDSIGEELNADAQVTKNKNILLGIQTADCVPILFIDEKNEVVGAAHAGWRSAIGGIITSTIEQMQRLGSRASDIDVVIGPCIRQKSYEVGSEFLDQFLKASDSNGDFFIKGTIHGKYMFDLPGYIIRQLSKYSFNNVFDVDIDTLEDEARFFSYRRSCLEGKSSYESILSVVGL